MAFSRSSSDELPECLQPNNGKSVVEQQERRTGVRRSSHTNNISSADYVIHVSPSRHTSRTGSFASLRQHDPAVADIEAGPQACEHNLPPLPSGRVEPSIVPASARASNELLQPLLDPEPSPAADAEAATNRAGLQPDDPFPATTAARAAAAEVARYRTLRHTAGALRARLAESTAAGNGATAAAQFQRQLAVASGLSWIVNILLLVAKLYAYYVSHSKAVLASAADSAVDLVSQMVIAYADWKMRMEDPKFPVGQARLEAIGVLACACIMSVASFEVIQESVTALYTALTTGELPTLDLGLVMYLVLGSATLLKLVCWAVCAALQSKSDSMLALAEDHLNDIMSNLCAILTAVGAGLVPNGWWIDPAGAIAISLYIVARWLAIAKQQVEKIVGRGAPASFIMQLEELANSHHDSMGLDVIRAYHFGARYIVEMEVVLPAGMSVRDSHDISLDLQHKVEQLEEVERAFVHVDYMRRDGLEHKVERELAIARALSTSSSGRISTTPDLSVRQAPISSQES